ncbi:MAG TPA: ABC transporter permease [Thermoplasmata archaeon]|nr:ABC transporter permease [Thermoplasmata archaeon]
MRLAELFAMPDVSRRTWQVWQRNKDVFLKTFKVNFLPPIAEPILYLAALGFGLGIFVKEIDGVPYPEFIAPALIAITIMTASFFECTYASFVRMYYQKTFDAIVATPLNVDEVITGEILWGATRSTISATIVLGVVTAFGLVQSWLALLIIPFSFLGGLLFASIAMCFTAVTPKIDNLNYPTSLFITPMFLVSGTFFPLSALPSGVQAFANAAVPLVHVVDITRALTLGHLELDLVWSLLWIFVATVVFFVLSLNLMKRRLIL